MGRLKQDRLTAEDRQHQAILLGELQLQKVDIFCWCNRCGHNTVLDVESITAQLGPHLPVPEIGTRLRCTGCGGKDVAARPAWPSLGQVTRHHGADTSADNSDDPE